MTTATRAILLIAGLLALSGLTVLGYETYAWVELGNRTTITVGQAFSIDGIYAPRGSEMSLQIIDWWFGTPVAASFLVASFVLFLLAILLATRTIQHRG
jgi:hypothetical protein